MGDGAQKLDQLESQIKELHQQALSTQSSLQQLKSRDAHSLPFDHLPDVPWVLGVEGLVLGLGALVLGGVLGWYAWRRPFAKPAPAEDDFADSQQYLNAEDQEPQLGVFKTPEVRATDGTTEHAFTRNFPEEVDFAQSAPMAESESVLNLFWDEEKPPLQESALDLLESVPGADASPFAPPSPSLEFDPEVAASEVERVRKSLADKRDARARQRMYDDWPRDPMHHPALASAEMSEHDEEPVEAAMPVDSPTVEPVCSVLDTPDDTAPNVEIDLALDLDLDLDLGADSQGESEPVPDLMVQAMRDLGQHFPESSADLLPNSDMPEPELAWDSAADAHEDLQDAGPAPVLELAGGAAEGEPLVEFEFIPRAVTQDAVPNLALLEPIQAMDVDVDAHAEPNPAVQLELAQEFLALDLLQGARELALEVLECGDATLQSQAQALIGQLDTMETAQRVGALIDAPAAL